jgi:predicted aldo/keto reductase-like oxidoreductase
MNGNSERMVGRLFQQFGRDKVYVGTKFHLRRNWNEKSIIRSVEGSLRRLQSDYIDVLLIHGASDENLLEDERVLTAFEKMKQSGKFRFKGLSCHTNHHNVIKKAVECGHYDMLQLGYNVFDIDDNQKEIEVYGDYLGASGIRRLISWAYAKDMGVIAMKTLKVGGRRQNLDKYKTGTTSIYQAMLKWALDNPHVSSAVIEMLNHQEMEEDLSVIGQTLSKIERKNLYRFVAENSKDYCHMCSLCQTNCPAGVKTTSILHCLAYHEAYNKKNRAKRAYSRLKPGQTAAACRDCSTCERTCPYGVAVKTRIRRAHYLLA